MRHRLVSIGLIAFGTVFLLVNLGVLPRPAVREFVATWWPLLPLAAAVVLLRRRSRCSGTGGDAGKATPAA